MRRLALDRDGWLVPVGGRVRRVPSPNRNERPAGMAVTLLVIHNISLPPGVFGGDAIEALFTNALDPEAHPYYEALRDLRVSSHFLVRRDGAIVQFVAGPDRAWHAGVSRFEEREGCNDFSIGIELEGTDDVAFEPAQYAALGALARVLLDRYPIEAVAGHSEIAPGRKTDPGPHFDWHLFLSDLPRALRRPASAVR